MTVLEACVRALGAHKGGIAAARVAQWAMVSADLGHVATTVEYADYWAMTERNGWAHRNRIRAAIGDDWQLVVEELAAEIKRRRTRSRSAVMQLDVPVAA